MKLQIEDRTTQPKKPKNASAILFGTVFRGKLGNASGPFTPEVDSLWLCTGAGVVDLRSMSSTFEFAALRVWDYQEISAVLILSD